jgi:hypothetical protein
MGAYVPRKKKEEVENILKKFKGLRSVTNKLTVLYLEGA